MNSNTLELNNFNTNKQRLDYLDAVKGIGILLVVFYHVYENQTFWFTKWFSTFMLPVFYVVTGILISYKNEGGGVKRSCKQIVLNNIQSLLYPYFVFSFLYIIFYLFKIMVFGKNEDIVGDIINAITLYGFSALWFLPSLLFSKLLFIFYMKKLKRFSVVFIFCLVMISSIVSIFVSDNPIFTTSVCFIWIQKSLIMLGRISIGTIFVFLGYYFYSIIKSKTFVQNKNTISVISIILLIGIIFPCNFNFGVSIMNSSIGNPFLFYLTSVIGSISLVIICYSLFSKCKIINFFGKNSLIVFVTHSGLIFFVRLFTDLLYKFAEVYVSTSITVMIQYILVLIIEVFIVIVINKIFPFFLKPTIKKK